MQSHVIHHQPDSPPEPTSAEATGPSWAVSVLFWLTLMAAATLYAAVALAPKLSVWIEARQQYIRNAQQLIALEQEVEYLERVQHALETDPEFVQRLSTSEHSGENENAELIPVTGGLIFGTDALEPNQRPDAVTETPKDPVYAGLVARLAASQRLRTTFLVLSATLVVFGFTFLNDADRNLVRSAVRLTGRIATLPVSRYRRNPGDASQRDLTAVGTTTATDERPGDGTR